jgi:hypothetical protein
VTEIDLFDEKGVKVAMEVEETRRLKEVSSLQDRRTGLYQAQGPTRTR